ncbi:hypothetical protein [Ruminococcus flavefaciens]|uniref:ATP-binding protein n=1 Tax=Ruminococcus flavefaciens TaxID=1265 RepID=UPI00048B162B|nr:hypothetical protein [Ruminococcus flavefaciens]
MFDELKGKRLLVLGGTAWADILFAFAAENDIQLVTTGKNPNKKFKEYYFVDSTDHEGMKNLIKEKNIDGVYVGSHEGVIRQATQYLAELGLPCYCTLQQWDTLMNKRKFKELCQKFDIPVAPKYNWSPDSPCEIQFPVIVKPADGCASVGIKICHNETDLKEGYQLAYDHSDSHEVLIEKLVNNSGMDVFFQITNSQIEFCGLGDKYPVQLAEGAGSVAGARILPSIYTEDFRARFEDKIKAMFSSVNLTQGLIWMEVFHVLNEYVDVEELKNKLEEISDSLSTYYQNTKVNFAKAPTITWNNPDGVITLLAKRIYFTRNALVHSKSGKNSERYRPYKDDSELQKELPLIKSIAEMIIIGSSTTVMN